MIPTCRDRAVLRPLALLLLAPVLAACGRTPSGLEEPAVTLRPLGDSIVFVAAGMTEQIQVAAVYADGGSGAASVPIQWQVVEGGASLAPAQSTTDLFGVASTLVLPGQAGTHRIRATTPRLSGAAPVIEVRVVAAPIITDVQPTTAAAGSEITITGSNFSGTAAHNGVYFSGMRGEVLSATPTELRVRVPACLPTRIVSVTVGLGGVISGARPLTTTGGTGTSLSLQPGQAQTFTDAAGFGCVRLPAASGGTMYLITAHNAAAQVSPPLPFELRALVPGPAAAPVVRHSPQASVPFAEAWETRLRQRERELAPEPEPGSALRMPGPTFQTLPTVGQEREFTVLNLNQTFDRVRAVARRVSQRAVLFVDVEAQDAFSDADLAFFANIFDSTIHPTGTSVFGEASDIDGNQRIFILFTPRVNALTPRGESSFITGFFFGCDLLPRRRCSGSNGAELFYSLVPDPQGKWSSPRSHATVRNTVPPVLAHEFQHMIHFARRGFSSDVLWLSEALAHTAEEVVGEALQQSDPTLAQSFFTGNYSRAQRYLMAPASAGVLAESGQGTVEMRGAAWLFLKHVRGHHGGTDLLRRLSGSTQNGVANVTQQTGQPWNTLVTEFGIALWADGAPELQGALQPRYRFVGFDLRAALGALPGGYSLRPITAAWADFAVTGSIAPGTQEYVLLSVPANGTGAPLNFAFSGERGAPIPTAAAGQLTVLRVR